VSLEAVVAAAVEVGRRNIIVIPHRGIGDMGDGGDLEHDGNGSQGFGEGGVDRYLMGIESERRP